VSVVRIPREVSHSRSRTRTIWMLRMCRHPINQTLNVPPSKSHEQRLE